MKGAYLLQSKEVITRRPAGVRVQAGCIEVDHRGRDLGALRGEGHDVGVEEGGEAVLLAGDVGEGEEVLGRVGEPGEVADGGDAARGVGAEEPPRHLVRAVGQDGDVSGERREVVDGLDGV